MSNYRRLISYIYAYEGGIKGKNIGFAKIEARGTQCKITVNVKKVYVGGNDIGVYLLAGTEEILLGSMFVRGGSGEFRTVVSASDVEHSGISMDQCFGLSVHDVENTWRSYTTIWEDAVAHAAELELPVTQLGKEEERNAAQEEQIKKAVKEIEEEFPLTKEEPVSPAFNENRADAAAVREQMETLAENAREQSRAMVDIIRKQAELFREADQEVTEPEAEGASPVWESSGFSYACDGTQDEAQEEKRIFGSMSQEEMDGDDLDCAIESEKPEAGEYQHDGESKAAQEETLKEQEPVNARPKPGNPTELDHLLETGENDVCSGQLWEELKRIHTKILDFDYEKGCEILAIKPQDIGLLPREIWVYGNNSFLLHGYYNYRYLILAKLCNPQGAPRYLLGVPGHFYSNEKYMAAMFGFPDFVLSKNQPMEDGRFGYWYTDINMDG